MDSTYSTASPVFDYDFLALEQFRWEGGVGAEDWLGSSLKPGKHTIVFDFKYDGPGPAKGGYGRTVGGWQRVRPQDDPAHNSVPHVHRRELRHW